MTAPSVHGALLLTQLCWGSAAVVNKLGLSGAGISPLLFALIREATATPILLLLLIVGRRQARGRNRSEEDFHTTSDGVHDKDRSVSGIALRLLPGLFIFLDQLCSLTGTTLADGTTAAAWQPSQVVFTLMISVCLQMESLTIWKLFSMLLTVSGALSLVFLGGHHRQDGKEKSSYFVGQVFFFVNCISASLEVIVWRKLLAHRGGDGSHLAVMAESYLVAACFMVVANVATSFSSSTINFLCPECSGDPWHVPSSALPSILYSVVFQTIVAYVAQAWALQHAPASLASLYATAQPVMASLVTITFLLVGFNPSNLLHWPGMETIGAVLIIAGLVVADYGSRRTLAADGKDADSAGSVDALTSSSEETTDSED